MNAAAPHWTDLIRALWPVFLVLTGLTASSIMLALRATFATVKALEKLSSRIEACELFKTQQETALGILPTRQQLGEQISRQGERLTETREEIVENVSEMGERVAGVEARMKGIDDRLATLNTYLHTVIERGLGGR